MSKPKKRKEFSTQEETDLQQHLSVLGLNHSTRKYLTRLDVDDNIIVIVAVFYALYSSRLKLMRYGIILVYLMSLGT
jgi:hypothetical protein